MPLGYECRQRMVKQNAWKPTHRRGEEVAPYPGPMQYDQPELIGGKGFSHIKRAPAYTFGLKTTGDQIRPVTTKEARLFNIRGFNRKGREKILHGVVSPRLEPPSGRFQCPGPGEHSPCDRVIYKRPPAYSITPKPRSPRKDKNMWTPSANMYCPPIPGKTRPAYTMGPAARSVKLPDIPGPGEHNPNFHYVQRRVRDVQFGPPHAPPKIPIVPAPNTYCLKRYKSPAPSFGIRHTPYLGQFPTHLKPSKLNIANVS